MKGLALLVLGAVAASACDTAEPQRVRNLLVVTLDSTRADRLEEPERFSELPLSLTHFLREASVYEGVASAPGTLPAVAALFTGRHPRELGHLAPGRRAPDDVPWLAERLRDAGYDTAAFVGSAALATGAGAERGFDHFLAPDAARLEDYQVTQAAREWLSEPARADRPWFAWVHLNAGHGPYRALETAFNPLNFFYKWEVPTPRGRDRKLARSKSNSGVGGLPQYQRLPGPTLFGRYRSLYDARVRVGDWFANELRHVLVHTEQESSTVVAVVGTHGEALGEHGVEFDHGHDLYDETLRVPFALRVPGRAGERTGALASHVDLAPTVAALFGLEPVASAGRDLEGAGPRAVFAETFPPLGAARWSAARTRDWAVLRGPDSLAAYDLRSDPGQERPLAPGAAPESAALLERLEAFEELGSGAPGPARPAPRDRARLFDLGYVLEDFD